MDALDAIRGRRMVRAFERRPVDADVLDRVLDAARWAPSAGNSQPVDLLVLDDPERYWQVTFDDATRQTFRWQGLFDAPILVIPITEPDAYVRRYAQADKGGRTEWPVPYWWVDGGAAVQNLLLAAHAEELGALFFGQFEHEAAIARAFGIPPGRRALGTVALGHPLPAEPGRSAGLRKRTLDEITHRGRW